MSLAPLCSCGLSSFLSGGVSVEAEVVVEVVGCSGSQAGFFRGGFCWVCVVFSFHDDGSTGWSQVVARWKITLSTLGRGWGWGWTWFGWGFGEVYACRIDS